MPLTDAFISPSIHRDINTRFRDANIIITSTLLVVACSGIALAATEIKMQIWDVRPTLVWTWISIWDIGLFYHGSRFLYYLPGYHWNWAAVIASFEVNMLSPALKVANWTSLYQSCYYRAYPANTRRWPMLFWCWATVCDAVPAPN